MRNLLRTTTTSLGALAIMAVGCGGSTEVASDVSRAVTLENDCLADRAAVDLACVGTDVYVATATAGAVLDGCSGPGDTATLDLSTALQVRAFSVRYDIGVYVATGDPADGQVGALHGSCSSHVLPTAPSPPYRDDDGDLCGDMVRDAVPTDVGLGVVTVPCLRGADGQLEVPYCLSWSTSTSTICTGPQDAFTVLDSKCVCGALSLGVPVPTCGEISCDDGNACTDDSCDPTSGCVHTARSGACDDGNACTTGDACSAGACVGGPPLSCGDGNVCTDDVCDPEVGCRSEPNASVCDDGNACTTGDTCAAGVCAGAALCDDGDSCTADTCTVRKGIAQCRHKAVRGCR